MSAYSSPSGASASRSDRSYTSEEAHAAWERRFPGSRTFVLSRKDDEPFVAGRCLGRGGNGKVYEIQIDGVPIALKQVDLRRKACAQPWYESKMLQKISTKRHIHVVELVGSYLHHQRGRDVLGLVLWPLAQFDLEHLLEELDVITTLKAEIAEDDLSDCSYMFSQDELDTLEDLSIFTSSPWAGGHNITGADIHHLHEDSMRCLQTLFGCLAGAVSYIHNDLEIRHRDLKPSQVLLSQSGAWLTDFGKSEDFSGRSTSATDGGEGMTPKYHAPERATMGECGRAEDIFALGCTYLEMAYRLYALEASSFLNPEGSTRFKYCENLSSIDAWLEPFMNGRDSRSQVLGPLIYSMLAHKPQDRPVIKDVLETLRLNGSDFFGPCCQPKEPAQPETKPELGTRLHHIPTSIPASNTSEAVDLPSSDQVEAPQSRQVILYSSSKDPLGSEALVTEAPWAARAFFEQFEHTHGELSRDDPLPFEPKRLLGTSPRADVHEINICGTVLAFKRIYYKRGERLPTVMPRSKRHRHIIELLGSYERNQGNMFELDLVLWPVADCNLSEYLEQTHSLFDRVLGMSGVSFPTRKNNEPAEEFDLLWKINGMLLPQGPDVSSELYESLYSTSLTTLKTYFGCLSSALVYLHAQSIAHRNLGTTNVLLSSKGPYLTGFGLYDGPFATEERAMNENQYTALEIQVAGDIQEELREFHADVVALGGVYVAMLAALTEQHGFLMKSGGLGRTATETDFALPHSRDFSAIDKALERLATAEMPVFASTRADGIQSVHRERSILQSHFQLSGVAHITRTMLGIMRGLEQRVSANTVIAEFHQLESAHTSDSSDQLFGQCCRPPNWPGHPPTASVVPERYSPDSVSGTEHSEATKGIFKATHTWEVYIPALLTIPIYIISIAYHDTILYIFPLKVLVCIVLIGVPAVVTYQIWHTRRLCPPRHRSSRPIVASEIPIDRRVRPAETRMRGLVKAIVFGKRWVKSLPARLQSDTPASPGQTHSRQSQTRD